MSQEKVDRYKKEKANREKIMRRERWITRLEVTAFVVVLATLIGWIPTRPPPAWRLVLRCCLPELGSREKGEPHERNHNDERDGYSELSERD